VKLLNDDELRRRLGALARTRVLENFTLQRSLDAYRAVYQGLLAPHASQASPASPAASVRPAPPRGERPRRDKARARGRASVGTRRWPSH
jgi:hypothetical protein